jgi:hypothetical protein
MITVVGRSGVHKIGVSWCCCHEAPKRDMQLMMAGLFPATFRTFFPVSASCAAL